MERAGVVACDAMGKPKASAGASIPQPTARKVGRNGEGDIYPPALRNEEESPALCLCHLTRSPGSWPSLLPARLPLLHRVVGR